MEGAQAAGHGMMNVFPEVQRNLGFGCMRLPMKDGEMNAAPLTQMADAFMAADCNLLRAAEAADIKKGSNK